eukprot:1156724-Pelagomonas_calceolata.AAC.5
MLTLVVLIIPQASVFRAAIGQWLSSASNSEVIFISFKLPTCDRRCLGAKPGCRAVQDLILPAQLQC